MSKGYQPTTSPFRDYEKSVEHFKLYATAGYRQLLFEVENVSTGKHLASHIALERLSAGLTVEEVERFIKSAET